MGSVCNPDLLPGGILILGSLVTISEPQFTHLQCGANTPHPDYLIGLFGESQRYRA